MEVRGVIHIGAHFGQEYNTYKNNGVENTMFFEPVPQTLKVLSEYLSVKSILINKALGNENKKMTMNIEFANNGQSSSLLEPSLHLKQYPHIVFEDTIDVEMVRLDDFINENYKIDYRIIGIVNLIAEYKKFFLKDVVISMLKYEPSKRSSLKIVLDNPLFWDKYQLNRFLEKNYFKILEPESFLQGSYYNEGRYKNLKSKIESELKKFYTQKKTHKNVSKIYFNINFNQLAKKIFLVS
jgi:FkbM family methyltransferase